MLINYINRFFPDAKIDSKIIIPLIFRPKHKIVASNNRFSLQIQEWYRQNFRLLPWRETKDPYKIWLSEVILQQTRVQQGLAYYEAFCTLFPTVQDLATASEQLVLTTWQGLGYYSRARNLHKAAQFVVNEHKGVFPADYKLLLKLPGIGPYTAAAIASLAYDLPFAVVDGNVYRLLSRYFNVAIPIDSGEGKKYFDALAQTLLDSQHAGMHNQAMMEMGALICTPKQPKCLECPLTDSCEGQKAKTINNLPVKALKIKVRTRYFHYLVIQQAEKMLFQQRIAKDIWQNMYQLPLIETQYDCELADAQLPKGFTITKGPSNVFQHVLSHQKIQTRFYMVSVRGSVTGFEQLVWLSEEEQKKYPLPRLIERYLAG